MIGSLRESHADPGSSEDVLIYASARAATRQLPINSNRRNALDAVPFGFRCYTLLTHVQHGDLAGLAGQFLDQLDRLFAR